MARIYQCLFVLCFVVTWLTNSQTVVVERLLATPMVVFELVTTLVLSACLWNGLLHIIKASGLIDHISFICFPLLRFIYGDVVKNRDVYQYLSSNFIANLLGIGTLASISGIQAMRHLQKHNPTKGRPTKEMLMLVVMNTTGLSIIPTTMMTLRQNLGSQNILGFFRYSFAIGCIITIVGVLAAKGMNHE